MVENNNVFPSAANTGDISTGVGAVGPVPAQPATPATAPVTPIQPATPASTPTAPIPPAAPTSPIQSATATPVSPIQPAAPIMSTTSPAMPVANPATAATSATLPRLGQKFRPAAPRADYSSPATGDIVLDHSTKKSKKPLIVALIVVGVLLVLIGVILIFISQLSPSLEESVDTYGNYILFGKTTGEIPSVYDENEEYYILKALSSDETTASFYSVTNEYITNLKKSSKKSTDSQLTQLIDAEVSAHEFLQILNNRGFLGAEDIVKYYSEHGAEATRQYIDNYYAGTNNEYAEAFRADYISAADVVFANISLFQEYDCLTDGVLDIGCFSQEAAPGDFIKFNENNKTWALLKRQYLSYNNLENFLVSNIIEINGIIRGVNE